MHFSITLMSSSSSIVFRLPLYSFRNFNCKIRLTNECHKYQRSKKIFESNLNCHVSWDTLYVSNPSLWTEMYKSLKQKRENNYQTKYLFLICSFRCSIFVIVQLGVRSTPRIHDVIHLHDFIFQGTVVGITSKYLNRDNVTILTFIWSKLWKISSFIVKKLFNSDNFFHFFQPINEPQFFTL